MTSASQPPRAAPAAEELPAVPEDVSALAGLELDEEASLDRLHELLVGRERADIDRLQAAVSGFLGAMVSDDALESLVRAMIEEALARRVRDLREEMGAKAEQLIVEAFRRELAVRKAELPEMVAPFLNHAISDSIQAAHDRVREEAERSVAGMMSREVAIARGNLPDEIAPAVRETVTAIARQTVESLRPEAEAMVAVAVEKEVAVQRGQLPETVAPYVDEAVAERIRLAERHIAPALEPALDEAVARLAQTGRQRLVQELSPVVVREVKERLRENQGRLQEVVDAIVSDMLDAGLRDAVGRRIEETLVSVRRESGMLRRSFWIIAGLALFALVLLIGLWAMKSGFDARLSEAAGRIERLERAAESPAPRPAPRESSLPESGALYRGGGLYEGKDRR